MRTHKLFNLSGLVAVVCILAFMGAGPWAQARQAAGTRRLQAASASTPADIGATCTGWTVAASPSISSEENRLQAIAATSPNDIWAVGSANTPRGNITWQSLIEHWNGIKWSLAPHPNPGSFNTQLRGVAAISSSDAWAVGSANDIQGYARTLVEQWNGSAWSIVPSPNVGSHDNDLLGVAAISANDVWAVGSYLGTNIYGEPADFTLVEHWDGATWSIVSSLSQGQYTSVLSGVVALSSTNVWAAGYYNNPSADQTLIEQWNGSTWSIVASPNAGQANALYGLAILSTTNVWAVGGNETTSIPSYGDTPLTEQWNGASWNLVSSPVVRTEGSSLGGVAVVPGTGGQLVAVGTSIVRSGQYNGSQPLVERWDGSRWTVYSGYLEHEFGAALSAVAAFGPMNMWAVGSMVVQLGSTPQTLILHYHTFHTFGHCPQAGAEVAGTCCKSVHRL